MLKELLEMKELEKNQEQKGTETAKWNRIHNTPKAERSKPEQMWYDIVLAKSKAEAAEANRIK